MRHSVQEAYQEAYDAPASFILRSGCQVPYQTFALPYEQELIRHINHYTSDVSLHICGHITKVLPLIGQTGASALSVDQNVDLEIAKQELGDQMVIMGNVDPMAVLCQGSPDLVAEKVKACYAKGKDSPKGFILRSGCGVPYNTPIENIKTYLQVAREEGEK